MSRYGKLATEFYELDKPEAPPDALDFYLEFARRSQGPIHEPMCGTGRFLLPMLAEGLAASGSDASPAMLEACQRLAVARGLLPQLSLQSVETLRCERPPALLLIPSGSFGLLLDDQVVARALRRLHDELAPRGTLLVEAELSSERPLQTAGTWGGRWVERKDGGKLVLSWLTQDSGTPSITSNLQRYELVREGQLLATEYEELNVRSYAPAEFRALLEAAGFSHVEAFKPYAHAPPDDEDEAIVFCATKA